MVRSWIAQEIDLAMTFSPPAQGASPAPHHRTVSGAASAPRTRDRRAAHRRRWALPAALAAMTLALLAPVPAAAATGDEAPAVEFAVAPGNQGVVAANQPLVLTLTAVNPGDTALAEGDVVIQRGVRRLTSEVSLDAWLDGGDAQGSFREIATAEVAGVAAQSEAGLTVAVDGEDAGVDDLAAGVYPIRAVYESGGETLTARSVIVKPRSSAGTAGVGVVVPITAGPVSTGLLSSDSLAELTGSEGSLRAQLDAVTATPAILAVDPAIVASIRVLGTAAPADAVDWLERLMALPNDRFALQFGDADLAAQVGAGVDAPLEMTSFAPYLDAANFATPADDGETPSPRPTPGAVVLPTVDDLLDVGATRDAVYWPATGTAGAEVATALGAAKTRESSTGTAITLLPDSVVSRGDVGARAAADDSDVLVYDGDLSAALREASTTAAPVERAAQLSAITARAVLDAASGPLLVTVDRADGRSSAALRDAILAVAGLPARVAVGLDALIDDDPSPVSLESVEADATRAATLAGFVEAMPALTRIASVLTDADLLLSNERATQLQLMGNAWLDSPDQWSDAVRAHQDRITAWSDGVALIPGQDISLLGSNAALVFTVRNDLPWAATVDLLTTPNDARLVLPRATPVVVGPEQTARVEVPVEALVGSGTSSIDLQLRSSTGVALGDRQTYTVAVQAEWESAAMIALSIIVTALLVLGVLRTVRRRRRGEVRSDGRAR